MTRFESRVRGQAGLSLILFGPLLVLGGIAALLALLAALLNWYPREMFITAAGLGGIALFFSLALVYRQVTKQRASDRVLQSVEARMSGVIDSAMDAIIAADDAQRIVLYNSAAEKVFRWPRSAVLGQPIDMLIPERFRSAHKGHIRRFGEAGITSRRMERQTVLAGLRANGEEFPIEASISHHSEAGRKIFTVILRDITERARAEEMLARGEARLRGILDSAMDAIITVDESQHIVLFNAAAEQVFGCPREQALGAPLSWFIPERFRAEHEQHVRRFGETGTSSRRMGAQLIVKGLRRSGEEFPIDASISQTEESGRKFYTVILRDVTERVRAEAALERSKEELRELGSLSQSLREREKSQVARELHDELAQALTALKMDVTWIAERLAPAEKGVSEKLSGVLAMLDSTVAATRRIAADLRPLLLDDLGLVAAVEWLVQNFIERTGIACELAMGSQDLDLREPHASAVFRIVQESLTNAARHARPTRVEVTLQRSGNAVHLKVRDDGRGFSMTDRRKPKTFGLMGLRERAALLGGETRIQSEPGRGTSIEATIPLAEEGVQP
jgi:PAS domain S-box-containing protein